MQLPDGEADRFEALAKNRHMNLTDLVRQLLLQEYYWVQRLALGGNDKILAQDVAQARGMRSASTLLHTLLYEKLGG